MIYGITGFVIGLITFYVMASHTLRHAVSIEVSSATIEKAKIVCQDNNGTFEFLMAYYDKDEIYCDEGFKIVAKKDRSQNMWTSFEVVKPEAVEDY